MAQNFRETKTISIVDEMTVCLELFWAAFAKMLENSEIQGGIAIMLKNKQTVLFIQQKY